MGRVESIEGCVLTDCVSEFVVNLQDGNEIRIPAEFSKMK